MGQARKRGTQEERQMQAKARIEALRPTSIVCNHCGKDIHEVQVMDSRGMVGIDGAFAGECECDQSTWAFAGNPDAVAQLVVSVDEKVGGQSKIGIMRKD
jgi:hypothetical protein